VPLSLTQLREGVPFQPHEDRFMRNLWRASLTLALVAFIASPAMGQRQPPRGGGGFGGFGGFALYTNKTVQEELKATYDQQNKAWKDMIGDKFEVKFERPGGGRPGGGRPGGGNPGGGRPRNDL